MGIVISEAARNRGEGRGYWHEMGMEVTDPTLSAVEAAKQASLDYTITKRPLQARNPRGHFVNVPSHFAIMSDYAGDPDVIAIVGKEFEPVQNMHLAEMLDASLLSQGYSLDVVGKTKDGRTVFWALKGQGYSVAGDEYKDHWLVIDGKDGNRALGLYLTPVRQVCSNALAMAVAGASVKVGISHTANAQKELGWWLGVAPQLDQAAQKNRELLSQMARYSVTPPDVEAVLEAAYPTPKARGKAQLYAGLDELNLEADAAADVVKAGGAMATELQRTLGKRKLARELFESYASTPEEKNVAGSLLGVINAVADVENHRQAVNIKEDVAVSNMLGQRQLAQAKSIKAALAIMG